MHTIFALLLILLSSVLSGLTDLSFTLNGYLEYPVVPKVNHGTRGGAVKSIAGAAQHSQYSQ